MKNLKVLDNQVGGEKIIKYIIVKELSSTGHNTYQVPMNTISSFLESKLDGYHVAYCEPMNKIVDNLDDFEDLIGLVKKVLIMPKIRGG